MCPTGPFDKNLFERNKMVKCVSLNEILEKMIKAEFTRKLSNFNFQWTKTLYQNNLYKIAFFLTFSRAKDVISHLQYFVWEAEKINVKFHKLIWYT